MFKLHNHLRAPALMAAALFCASLAADDIKIGIQSMDLEKDVSGNKTLLNWIPTVRGAFSSVISATQGFQQFIPSALDKERVIKQRKEVEQSGHYSADTGKELGEFKDSDYLLTFELSAPSDEEILVVARVRDQQTFEVAASGQVIVTSPSTQSVNFSCQDLMTQLLSQLNAKMSGRSRPINQFLQTGIADEIQRLITNNPLNTQKKRPNLDLSGLSVNVNREFGTTKVSGYIRFTSGAALYELDIKPFTLVSGNDDLVKEKVKAQVRADVGNIINTLFY